MAFELAPLPYANNALEPHIDARTMEIHHDKHHQAYVTNLTNATKDTDMANASIEDLVKSDDGIYCLRDLHYYQSKHLFVSLDNDVPS